MICPTYTRSANERCRAAPKRSPPSGEAARSAARGTSYERHGMSDVDDKLDAAWRAASREEPPAALDDALRAAARRAVGARPSRERHMQSWPLAAAAVVAVLAIGIVQMTPPEQVTPTIVAHNASTPATAKEKEPPAPPAAPAPSQASPRVAEQPPAPSAPATQTTTLPPNPPIP